MSNGEDGNRNAPLDRNIPGPAGVLLHVRRVRARIAEAVAPDEPPQFSTQQILNALNQPGVDNEFCSYAWREAERFVSEGGVEDFVAVLAVEQYETAARHQSPQRPLSLGTFVENISNLRAAFRAGRKPFHRFSHLVAVIKEVSPGPEPIDRYITMKDPTGTIKGYVHKL